MRILESAPHETLHRGNGVFRILRLHRLRRAPHIRLPVGEVTHDRGQQHLALGIRQRDRDAVPDRRDQGIGCSEVYAGGKARLMGFR